MPIYDLTIPKVRDYLQDLARDLRAEGSYATAQRIEYAVLNMYRRPPVKRAPRKSANVTPNVRHAIRVLHATDPTLSNREIGAAVNVDGGRVSEELGGKRK